MYVHRKVRSFAAAVEDRDADKDGPEIKKACPACAANCQGLAQSQRGLDHRTLISDAIVSRERISRGWRRYLLPMPINAAPAHLLISAQSQNQHVLPSYVIQIPRLHASADPSFLINVLLKQRLFT